MPRFKLSFLHPRFWLTWLGLLLFFFFTLLPLPVINATAERLGDYALSAQKRGRN
jgi:KDO2-lipid IV(A) lauroyltransferase